MSKEKKENNYNKTSFLNIQSSTSFLNIQSSKFEFAYCEALRWVLDNNPSKEEIEDRMKFMNEQAEAIYKTTEKIKERRDGSPDPLLLYK